MSIFDEYSPPDKDAVLAGDLKEWTWFKMCVFTKKKIDLEKKPKILNDLLLKHKGNNYDEFPVVWSIFFCVTDLLVLSQKQKQKKSLK